MPRKLSQLEKLKDCFYLFLLFLLRLLLSVLTTVGRAPLPTALPHANSES